MNQPRILIIEDDEAIGDAIVAIAKKNDLDPVHASDGRSGLTLCLEEHFDLVVLDIGLPIMDGWEVLERIRAHSTIPVLMLTALDGESDKVRALEAGADDYLTKPFGIRELGARLVALLRRSTRTPAQHPGADRFVDGSFEIDFSAHTVIQNGRVVAVTELEFQLLDVLVTNTGTTVLVEHLVDLLWDVPFPDAEEWLKFTVFRLRRKLGWTPGNSPLEAVRGEGYRYLRRH